MRCPLFPKLLFCLLALAVTTASSTTSLRGEDQAPLITRNQVTLNLAGAELILAGAKAKAAEMQLKVNIAIVDDGGHQLAFVRMDGARPASATTALHKAVAAATTRLPTGPIRNADANAELILNFSLQSATAAGPGKMIGLYGGVPIVINGQTVGAVGVGGATGEQDAEIARAGIAKLLKALETDNP